MMRSDFISLRLIEVTPLSPLSALRRIRGGENPRGEKIPPLKIRGGEEGFCRDELES